MVLLIGILVSATALFCALTNSFALTNVMLGAGLSAALMWLFRKQISPKPLAPIGLSFHLLLFAPVLIYYLLVDIIAGTIKVALITLRIKPLVKPGIVKIPLKAHSPYGVGPVGFFITLSPGSVLLTIDWDERQMLVHAIDASNPDQIRRDAEKYYRLWEYGPYRPTSHEPAPEEGDGANA